MLKLNTGEKLKLIPELLYVQNDQLYFRKGDNEIVKFTDRAMRIICEKIEEKGRGYILKLDGNQYDIAEW